MSGGNFAARGGNAGTFNGGARMGRMDHDHHDHDGRFRGSRFAFGYSDYYNNYDYDDDYDPGCYS